MTRHFCEPDGEAVCANICMTARLIRRAAELACSLLQPTLARQYGYVLYHLMSLAQIATAAREKANHLQAMQVYTCLVMNAMHWI